MIRSKVIFFLIMIPFSLAYSQVETVLEKLPGSVDKWFNNELSHNQFIEILNNYEEGLDNDNSYSYYHTKSIIKLYKGQVYYEKKDSISSINELEKSFKSATYAKEIRETSDSWSVMAYAGSLIMIQKGVAYIISNSGKVNDHAKNSLSLDKNNIRGAIVFAQGLINAPMIFGGNKKEGIRVLENLLKKREISKEYSYIIYMIMAELYQKQNKIDKSLENCRYALIVYPNNRNALKLIRELESTPF